MAQSGLEDNLVILGNIVDVQIALVAGQSTVQVAPILHSVIVVDVQQEVVVVLVDHIELFNGILASLQLRGQAGVGDILAVLAPGVVQLGQQAVVGTLSGLVSADIAIGVEVEVVLHVLVHVGQQLVQTGLVVDVRLLVDSTVSGGSGLVLEGNSVNGGLGGLRLLDDDLVVDIGVEHDVAHSDLILIDDDAVITLTVLDIEVAVLEDGFAALGVGADGLVQPVLGEENVLGAAVAVVIDDLQPLAVAAVAEILIPDLGVDVLSLELAEGDIVGDIPLLVVVLVAGGLGADVNTASDLILVQLIVVFVVGRGEDTLHDIQILSGDLVIGTDNLGVGHGIGTLTVAVLVVGPAGDVDNIIVSVLHDVVAVVRSNNGNIRVGVEMLLSLGILEGDGEVQAVVAGEVALAAEVQIELGVTLLAHAGEVAELLVTVNRGAVAGLLDHVLAGVLQGIDGGAGDIGVTGLADVGDLGGDVQTANVILGQLQIRFAVSQDLGVVEVGVLVSDDHALDLLQLEAVIAESGVGLLIAERVIVGNGGHQDGAEEQLGDDLAGSGGAQQGGGHILADLQGVGAGGGVDGPVGADELVHLAIPNSAQDHGQGLVACHVVVGTEGAVLVALDVLGIGAVVDVAGVPGAGGDVLKAVPIGVQGYLGIGHIAGSDAVDDGGDFGAGDGILRLVAAIGVAPEHFQLSQDIDGLVVSLVDVRLVAESRVGGDYEREAHNQCQGQCENLLQISHGGFGPPF